MVETNCGGNEDEDEDEDEERDTARVDDELPKGVFSYTAQRELL